MKKLVLLFLLIPSLCFAVDAASIMGKSADPSGTNNVDKVNGLTWGTASGNATTINGVNCAAAATCTTAGQNCTSGTNGDGGANWVYLASQITASETATICAIAVNLKRTTTVTGTYKIGIYSNNASGCSGNDCPGSLIGSWSDDYNRGDLTTSYVETKLTKASGGLGASLSSGTKYWIVLGSASYWQQVVPQNSSSCNTVTYCQQSDNGTSWTAVTQHTFLYKLYK